MPICIFCGDEVQGDMNQHVQSSKSCSDKFAIVKSSIYMLYADMICVSITDIICLTTPNDGFLGLRYQEHDRQVFTIKHLHFDESTQPLHMILSLVDFVTSVSLFFYDNINIKFNETFKKVNKQKGLLITSFSLDFYALSTQSVSERCGWECKDREKIILEDTKIYSLAQNPPGKLYSETLKEIKEWE